MSTEITTDRYGKAISLHNRIMVNGAMVAQSLAEMCKDLKEMRDEKLYIDLGYEAFDTYCEEKVGIKSRQVYTYISAYEKLGPQVIEDNASLGITKLNLLAQLNPVDRVEALESGELNGMSTREIEELVKKSTEQAEQLSLITEEKQSAEDENNELTQRIEDLEAELEELRNKPTEVAVQLPSEEERAEMKNELAEELHEFYELEKQKAVDKAVADAKEEAEKAAEKAAKEKYKSKIEKAEQKAKDAATDAEKQLAEAKEETAQLKARLSAASEAEAELQKKLDLSDGAGQTVTIYFEALQSAYNNIVKTITGLDEERSHKYTEALKAALNQFLQNLEG